MKIEDFESEHLHGGHLVAPKMQRDMDNLSAMVDTLEESIGQSIDHLRIRPLNDHKMQHIGGGLTIVVVNGKPQFKGLVMCPECCRRAVMFLRDSANVLSKLCDIADEIGVKNEKEN